MDSVVAEVERRLEAYDDPIEVSVLGCAVNGIGEARHADFGITGAKDMGMIYSKGEPIKKVATGAPRRRALHRDRQVLRRRQDGRASTRPRPPRPPPGCAEEEDATAMTPERLAKLEAEKASGRRRRDRRGALAGRRPPLHPRLGRRITFVRFGLFELRVECVRGSTVARTRVGWGCPLSGLTARNCRAALVRRTAGSRRAGTAGAQIPSPHRSS